MKKGQQEGLSIVFSILFLSLVIFLMIFLFVANRGKIGEEKLNSIKISENQLFLLNYLRTPIEYEGGTILIGDLIVLKNEDKLKEEGEKILSDYCKDESVCKVTLDYGGDKIVISSKVVHNFVSTSSNEFVLVGYEGDIIATLEKGYDQKIRSYSKLKS
ncbi:MAG: hypothetical protein KJ674_03095 [Nanoarchaeota archaeon]|nr:hypothetical protein [Nanoarchaeota archaeon]